jgi:predicted RNA-binding protein YlxR (DUF448 family)/ribosomal protein L30E
VTSEVQTVGESRARRAPERTCVACRRTAGTDALLRLARTPDGEVVADWRSRLGGRGAHVCPTRRCISEAIRGKALDRAFRASVRYPEAEELVTTARRALERTLGALLGSAVGARRAVSGADAVKRAVALGHAVCIVVAADAAERSDIEGGAAARGLRVRVAADKGSLGEMLGKRPTAVMAIIDRGLAEAVSATLDRLEALQ